MNPAPGEVTPSAPTSSAREAVLKWDWAVGLTALEDEHTPEVALEGRFILLKTDDAELDEYLVVRRVEGYQEWIMRTTDSTGENFVWAVINPGQCGVDFHVEDGRAAPPGSSDDDVNWICQRGEQLWNPSPLEVERLQELADGFLTQKAQGLLQVVE